MITTTKRQTQFGLLIALGLMLSLTACALFGDGEPDSPENLLIGRVTETSVEIWWSFATQEFNGIAIERSPNGIDDWVEIDVLDVGETKFVDDNLSCGKTYYYRLRGYDAVTKTSSDYSAVAAVTTKACTGPQATPTLTPSPTATEESTAAEVRATPTTTCTDAFEFVRDVSTPDGTTMSPGTTFTKSWRVKNTGTCAWTTDYALAFNNGDKLGGPAELAIPRVVPPEATIDLSVRLTAPQATGDYTGEWLLRNPPGRDFGASPGNQPLVVKITVYIAPTATPVPTATPITTFNNWKGEYYNNITLTGNTAALRDDTNINFDWGDNAPVSGMSADEFSVRWTRSVNFSAGVYRFTVRADDGVRVYLDGELIIDDWTESTATTLTADRAILAGSHDLKVEYFEKTGGANISVSWAALGDSSFSEWKGSYYSNMTLSGSPILVRNDKEVNFDWGTSAPVSGMSADKFSVRWERTVNFAAGVYEFNAQIDDGVRVYVDDQLLIDDWQDGASRKITANITLAAGDHKIRVEYFDNELGAIVHVWWNKTADLKADLTISMVDSPDPATAGSNITYTVTIKNDGNTTANSSALTVNLHPGYTASTAVSTQGTCTIAGVLVTCNMGNINQGQTVTVTIVIPTSVAETISSTAAVTTTTTESNSGNNSATASTVIS